MPEKVSEGERERTSLAAADKSSTEMHTPIPRRTMAAKGRQNTTTKEDLACCGEL